MNKLSKFVQSIIVIAILFLIIFLYSQVSHLFTPILTLAQFIFVPIILALFFYYLLRPVIAIMLKYKVNRSFSILIIFAILTALLIWIILAMLPTLQHQFMALITNAPSLFNAIGNYLMDLQKNELFTNLFPEADFEFSTISAYINKALTNVNSYIGSLFSFVSNFTIILFTTPIVLFFMLKESEKFPKRIINGTPHRYKAEMTDMLKEYDDALSNFITGRVLVNVALGILMYIGFAIIDLPYALLFTTIAVIANFIPFVGAIISSIPIVIVALVDSPGKAIWALIIILAAQQIQDNLIAPYIFGRQLNIHPLTTIILVLGAGKIGGIIAMIVVIPVYLLIKITAIRVYRLFLKEKWENI